MRAIVNKDDDLIVRYLSIRQELIDSFKKNKKDDDNGLNNYWLSNAIEEEGRIDSLLYEYDKTISESKLSKNANLLIKENIIKLVKHNFTVYEYRYGIVSFETKEERIVWLDKESFANDYNAFNKFDCLELTEIKGTIDDNYNDFIDKMEKGYEILIKADSLYKDNLIGLFIEE